MFQQPQKSTPARFVTGVLDMHGKVKSLIRVKSYKCQICEKAFVKKSSCMEHEKLHSGMKPFKCPHCDMWYASLTLFYLFIFLFIPYLD